MKLDGAILDQEILHLLESQVKKIFQKFQVEQFQFLSINADACCLVLASKRKTLHSCACLYIQGCHDGSIRNSYFACLLLSGLFAMKLMFGNLLLFL